MAQKFNTTLGGFLRQTGIDKLVPRLSFLPPYFYACQKICSPKEMGPDMQFPTLDLL